MTWRRAQMIAPGLDIPLNITESEELPQPLEGGFGRVERCGVCHRDLIDRGARPFVNFPVAPGHEVCGVIEAVGLLRAAGPSASAWPPSSRCVRCMRSVRR